MTPHLSEIIPPPPDHPGFQGLRPPKDNLQDPFWDKAGFGYGTMTPRDLYDIDRILTYVRRGILSAFAKHPPAHSTHEVLGQLAEEMDELIDAVRADNPLECTNELRDVAVVAVRGMLELGKWKGGVRKP